MQRTGFTPKIKFGIFPLRNRTIVWLVLDTLTFANVMQPLNNVGRSLDTLCLLSGCRWCVVQCRVWRYSLRYAHTDSCRISLLHMSVRYALTDSCTICLLHISVRFKVIPSVPCVYLSSSTSVIHCSFRSRHFLEKNCQSVCWLRHIGPPVRPTVCLSVRVYRLDSQRTDIHKKLHRCLSLTFVSRFKFCKNQTHRTDTLHADMRTIMAF